MNKDVAPHVCPLCGSPCYIGLTTVQCVHRECAHYHEETAAYYNGAQRDLILYVADRQIGPPCSSHIVIEGASD